jgi:hypothetical protein
MARTRTPGITIASDGRRFIDKEYRGVRIGPASARLPKNKPSKDFKSK